MDTKGLRTWIEIDKAAIAHNYKLHRSILGPDTNFLAVVKSNAYGHSIVDFSREIEKLGADWLGVDSIVEGLTLRKEGIKAPILVLGYTLPDRFQNASDENISIAVSTFETLNTLASFDKKLAVHIKVDTGMHRQGFMLQDLEKVISILKALPENISVEGLCTHLASDKNPEKPETALKQYQEFEIWRKAFIDNGLKVIFHMAASAGTMQFPNFHFDMVRYGGSLYGIWPSAEVKQFMEAKLPLIPILTWKTVISEIKQVPEGDSVGYDFTETLTRDTRLAVCPVGYWHGLPRALSSFGEVLVCGKRAKIIGRVSMDMFVIDITDIPQAQVFSEVTMIGKDGEEEIPVAEMAKLANTSEYEIVTRLNPLIKKIYL